MSPAIAERRPSESCEEIPTQKRGNVFAPESAIAGDVEGGEDVPLGLTVTDLRYREQVADDTNVNQLGAIQSSKGGSASPISISVGSTAAKIQKHRQDLNSYLQKPHGLLPGMLPRLRTLVLTGVPCSGSSRILELLVGFIRACALEVEIARLQNLLKSKSVPVPRGSQVLSSASRSQHSLQRIVLEMGPPPSRTSQDLDSPRAPHTAQYAFRTKSSTEDPDSEALWSASQDDFSFFDDDEECGLSSEPSAHLPMPAVSEKNASSPDHTPLPSPSAQVPCSSPAGLDIVQELAKFREERKAAYQAAILRGEQFVEGYWPGEIKIVRWQAKPTDRAGFYGIR